MVSIRQITPFIHVPDLEAAVTLFRDILAFEVVWREEHYAYVELGGCGLRILEEPSRRLTPDGKARVNCYVDVVGVDALHAQIAERLARLPADRVEPLMDKSWHMREFQVRLPDGDWMTFGEPKPWTGPGDHAPAGPERDQSRDA